MPRGTGALSPAYDEALGLASSVHRAHTLKGSDVAYLSHVMTVSALVLEDDGSEDQAIAGLLHDVTEDGPPFAADEIERRSGRGVRDIVQACTDGVPGSGAISLGRCARRRMSGTSRTLLSRHSG